MNRAKWALAVVSLTTLAVPALAQGQNIRSITLFKIKADRVGDFTAAVKEYNAVLTKAGATRTMSMYHRLTGEREYVLVTTRSKWGEFGSPDPKLKDVQGQLSLINARINSTVASSDRIMDEKMADLSLPVPAKPAKMVRTLRVRVRPDKVNEYIALMKSDLMPAIKKSNAKSFATYRVMYGSSRYEFRSSTGIDSWDELDEPALSNPFADQAAYDKYLAKVRPLITQVEYNVATYMPDLSYVPAT